jgi:hypothetical protein
MLFIILYCIYFFLGWGGLIAFINICTVTTLILAWKCMDFIMKRKGNNLSIYSLTTGTKFDTQTVRS